MPRNTELIRAVAQAFRDDPDSYDQQYFARQTACGTAYCISGKAAILSGKLPAFESFDEGSEHIAWYFFSEGEQIHGQRIGQTLLGLTVREGDILFDEQWQPADGLTVPEVLERLADGETIDSVTHPDHLFVED